MAKKSSGNRNDNRKCGKAWKKNPRKPNKTGRTTGGYSPKKLALRATKRATPYRESFAASVEVGTTQDKLAKLARELEGNNGNS